jgi:hypothetical protein
MATLNLCQLHGVPRQAFLTLVIRNARPIVDVGLLVADRVEHAWILEANEGESVAIKIAQLDLDATVLVTVGAL